MTRIKAVIFDLDDTLISTRQLYVAAFAHALRPHKGRLLSEDELAALTPRAEDEFIHRVVGPEAAAGCLETFYGWYETLHPTHFDGVYDGVSELLATLQGHGLRIGVVTGKSRRAWEISSRHVSLPGVSCWVFGDDVGSPKPSPDGVLSALASLKVVGPEAIYIGDSTSDMAAANAAGVLPGAALWSRTGEESRVLEQTALDLGGLAFPAPSSIMAHFSRP